MLEGIDLSKETRHILGALTDTTDTLADECDRKADRLVNTAMLEHGILKDHMTATQTASEAIRLRGEARAYRTVRDGIRKTLARPEKQPERLQSAYHISVDVTHMSEQQRQATMADVEYEVRGWARPYPIDSKPCICDDRVNYYFTLIDNDTELDEQEAVSEIRANLSHLSPRIQKS